MLIDDELLEKIYDVMWGAKSIAAWAEAHGIARQNLNATLLGKRAPTPQIAAAVEYKRLNADIQIEGRYIKWHKINNHV